MQKRLFTLLSNPYFTFFALTLAFFVLNFENISQYWNLTVVGGWDGAGHAAIGEYYANHIFPKTWGWVPYWLGGMPFPQFYPPLFFFLTALLSKILFFASYTKAFQLLVIFLQIIVPGTLALVTRNIVKSPYATWIAGIITIVCASTPSLDFSFFGIAINVTFNSGFVAQLLGFILLLLWLNYFLKIEESRFARYASILFLCGVFLSNAHLIPVSLIIFAATFLVKIRKHLYPFNKKELSRYLALYFFSGFGAVALSAFWSLPLLKTYTYLLTSPIWVDTLAVMEKSWYLIVFIVIGILWSIKSKNENILAIAVVNIFIVTISIIRLDQYLSFLPLHSARWLAEFFFLSIIVVAFVFDKIITFFSGKNRKIVLVSLATVMFLLVWSVHPFELNSRGIYKEANNADDKTMLEYLKGKTGRVVVENYLPATPVSAVLDSQIGPLGDGVATFILRESSITDQFTVPVRNSVSQNYELWGIKSFKAIDKALMNKPLDEAIRRAVDMGIKYFLVRTLFTESRFKKSELVTLEKTFGLWKVYVAKDEVAFAEIPKYEPVLLFSHLNFKDRGINEYNYSRFQEEVFFGKNRDILLVHAQEPRLDTSKDLNIFKTAIISDYAYDNIDRAYERLERYSLTHPLVLVLSTDPLFNKLSTLDKQHKIIIAPRNMNVRDTNVFASNDNFQNLLDKLNAVKIPLATKASVKSVNIQDTQITVDIDSPDDQEVPVLIKESYFPTWKNRAGGDVYLATPTFMLTYAKDDIHLDFETDSSVYIGTLISLITIIITLSLYYKSSGRS